MNLMRYRPQRGGLVSLHDAVDDVFNRFFEDWGDSPMTRWVPALDLCEREDAVVVRAEMPGMGAEDIDLSVHGDTLTISGEKNERKEDEKDNVYHTERRYGRFQRSVTLPMTVDAGRIEATFKNGVLVVTLPKSEQAKPRKIEVKKQ